MMNRSNLILSTSPPSQTAKKLRGTTSLSHRQRFLYGRTRRYSTGKERDSETGLHYYGARYLDGRTGRWLSGDPAVGDYVPSAPVDDEARKRNGNLPGQGGVFNYVNLHVYHYAGNNPVKLVDPDGNFIWVPLIIAAAVTTGLFTATAMNVPSKEEHRNRNQYNRTTDDDGNSITTKKQAEAIGYKQLGIEKGEKNAIDMAVYHKQGTAKSGKPDPANNQKYVLPDVTGIGSSELIFNGNDLVKDSVNQGTYNFADAEKSKFLHFAKDIVPYVMYGNDEVDAKTTEPSERLRGSYSGPLPE
jgi:RHS repeat-associated protein